MENPEIPLSINVKPEEVQVDLNVALNKFFKHEDLTAEESEAVNVYRQKCIEFVSKNSTKYSDIPTDFEDSSIDLLKVEIEHSLRTEEDQKNYSLTEETPTLKRILKGKTMVDLGSGPKPMMAILNLFNWGAEKLVAVDIESPPDLEGIKSRVLENPTTPREEERAKAIIERIDNGKIKSVESDSLQYLLDETADGSHFIISSGAFAMGEVIPFGSEKNKTSDMSVDYLRFLAHEIARLTPKGGLTYHCGHSNYGYDSPLAHALEEEGFKMIAHEQYSQSYTLWQKE